MCHLLFAMLIITLAAAGCKPLFAAAVTL